MNPHDQPVPLSVLADMAPELVDALRRLGIVTCEQAWELVDHALRDPAAAAELGLHVATARLTALREALEAIVPEARRAEIQGAGAGRWLERHPPGVLEPKPPAQTDPDDGDDRLDPPTDEDRGPTGESESP